MSLTPATADALRSALATVVAVPVLPLHADGNPDWDSCWPESALRDEITGILDAWGLT